MGRLQVRPLPRVEVALALSLLNPTPYPREEMLRFLPEAFEVPGLLSATEGEHYPRETLWVRLDGAATTYIAYDCLQMVVRDYRGPKGNLAVLLFDLGTPLLAFGLFSALRSAEAQPVEVGTVGALTEGEVLFVQGRFLVSVVGSEASTGLSLARRVAQRLPPAPSGLPPELNLLPSRHRLPHTERFVLRDVLAMEFLHHGLAASYRIGGREGTLWLCDLGEAGKAREAFQRYGRQLLGVRPWNMPGAERALQGEEALSGPVWAALQGNYLLIVQGFSASAARRLLEEALARLRPQRTLRLRSKVGEPCASRRTGPRMPETSWPG